MEESIVALLGKYILDKSLITNKVCRYDDDCFDRLNHVYTTALIGICVSFMFTRQLVGKPITCWLPTEFSESQVTYAEHVCWVMSTYYVNLDESMPYFMFEGKSFLNYYQWIPFILIGQAILYMVPYVLWCAAIRRYRGQLIETLQILIKVEINTPPKEKIEHLLSARRNIHKILRVCRGKPYNVIYRTSGNCRSASKCLGAHNIIIVILYLCSKTLYLVNSLVQLIIMSKYLQINNIFFGIELITNFVTRQDWTNKNNFPRVTFCDFDIYAVGQSLKYTSQCVLVVNMFNEKIYLFLWLWNVFLIFVNFYSFLKWCYRSASNSYRKRFIKKLLNQNTTSQSDFPHLHSEFINSYLQHDGSFLIQLIHHNLGQYITLALVQFLWDRYIADNKNRKKTIKTPVINKNIMTLQDLERGVSSVSYNETFHTSKL